MIHVRPALAVLDVCGLDDDATNSQTNGVCDADEFAMTVHPEEYSDIL